MSSSEEREAFEREAVRRSAPLIRLGVWLVTAFCVALMIDICGSIIQLAPVPWIGALLRLCAQVEELSGAGLLLLVPVGLIQGYRLNRERQRLGD